MSCRVAVHRDYGAAPSVSDDQIATFLELARRRDEVLVTREVWRAAVSRARVLDAYRQRPVGQWPYVWELKAPRVLLRWYDYAMGCITGEDAGSGKVRYTLLILGCTGEIRNPAAYVRLRGQFFAELLD